MAKRVFQADGPEPPADVVALYGDLHGQPGRYLVRLANGGWIWAASPRASGTPGAGASWKSQAECATSVLVEVAVTGTATPDDQGDFTTGLGDQTQTPAPLSQRPQGTTNAPSPVSPDHEAVSSRVSSGASPDQPDGIADDSHDLPDPVRAAARVNEFLAQWGDGLIPLEYDGLPPLYARDLQALANLASPLPAPRVFFPGDTVPAGVAVMSFASTAEGLVLCLSEPDNVDRMFPQWAGPALEIALPTAEEWQATVDRAKAARADSEWQHTEGVNP